MTNINRLVKQYERIYGKTINVSNWGEDRANQILEMCSLNREKILMESHFNSYMQNKDYARILILETLARQVLIEIAPKRIKKRGSKKNG